MADKEWVLVQRSTEKDWWNPSWMEDNNGESSKPLKVTFSGPAKHWTDAIPIGNGRLGAMIWGGVALETLQLNEDTLWTGIPGDYTNPNAPAALSEVRKLVDNGQYAEATTAAEKLSGNQSDVYQLLGDIKLEFDDSHLNYDEKTYKRELDLDTATATVKYSVADIEYTREHFASNPNQVIVTKISGSKPGSVSFTVSLDSKMSHHSYVKGENQIIIEGSCPGNRYAQKLNENDSPQGIQFTAILDLQVSEARGLVRVSEDSKLRVEGSDWAVLLLVSSSSFDGPFTKPIDSKKNPTSDSLSALKSIGNLSYVDLYAHHLDDYQSLFHRFSLQLSKSSKNVSGNASLTRKEHMPFKRDLSLKGSEDDTVSTAERVKAFQTDEDPSLVELLFQYGRYLLISCSRPGTQVANLQGIWNKDLTPPWDGAQHLNINLQMNYWPSLSCNLKECQEPLFEYISSLSISGSKTAKVNYEAKGWVAHQVSDLWAKTSPDAGQALWALWPMGGAWLCTHLWEHYTYTMDKDFLRDKAYSLLEGCTSFLLDWLIEGPGGYLETNPSTSPEHMFIAPDGKPASVSYSSTMDMSIIKEVFSAIVSAAKILGRNEDELVQRVLEALPRLLRTKISRDGSIMEWAQDFQDPEVHHRHVSHLFGLFPGHTITVEKTTDLCKAAGNTLYKRGEDGPGWSTMWKAALWARLHNSEHAYRMVKHLFVLVDPENEGNYEGGLYSNLFTAHPPFQIDANFGFPAAIAEMLVQSTAEDLYLLPALPRDKWANGCVKGLKARGKLTVNICWKEGDLREVGLWSNEQNSLKRLNYRGMTVKANLSPGRVYTFNRTLKCIKKQPLPSAASC
ncbi:PREDICTED: alpha-L-fucosidase 2-like [Populus euphratica]|uniref:Alpha-L-fucosidase 2-like n=1 Tax=Populus euphratica TaxID=75702 RepID=A0AAJ6XT68_POPEU|nr:PREDICTED: alpha-L-fucosidase 2-like [Populus euphratica]